MTFYPYRLVRSFEATAPSGGTLTQELYRVVELPLTPALRFVLHVPGDGRYRVVGITVEARETPPQWLPGFKAIELVAVGVVPVDVEGLREPAAAMAGAFERGWSRTSPVQPSVSPPGLARNRTCACGGQSSRMLSVREVAARPGNGRARAILNRQGQERPREAAFEGMNECWLRTALI